MASKLGQCQCWCGFCSALPNPFDQCDANWILYSTVIK